jgi:hypothetical protein
MRTRLWPRFAALISFFYMMVMNTVATTLPLNGLTPDQISDKYDTLFAPIGFTFSIWGIIFTLLGVYSVYQLLRDNEWIRTITPWFIASNLLNGTWIVAWHYEVIWVSLVIIVSLLLVLIRITRTTTSARVGLGTTFAMVLPFNVYFGWITVATVANVSALLVQQGWRGGGILSEEAWTIVILVVAAAIGVTTALSNRSIAYGLVLVWAYFGILSRHLSPEEWNEQYPSVILTAQILLPILGIAAVIALVRWVRQPKKDLRSISLRKALR